jgi:hypothetical protein
MESSTEKSSWSVHMFIRYCGQKAFPDYVLSMFCFLFFAELPKTVAMEN